MIDQARRWGRRARLVVAVPIFLPLLLLVSAIEAAADEMRHEWRETLGSIKQTWRDA